VTAQVTYSLSQYDAAGDLIESGVFLYFDHNVAVRVCDTREDFDLIVEQMLAIQTEIQNHYK
jgi:hypothetical protein